MGFPFEFAEKREQAICPLTSSCSLCPLWFNIFHSVNGYAIFIVTTMGLKPSPSGESFRFLYWGDGKLPNEFAQSL